MRTVFRVPGSLSKIFPANRYVGTSMTSRPWSSDFDDSCCDRVWGRLVKALSVSQASGSCKEACRTKLKILRDEHFIGRNTTRPAKNRNRETLAAWAMQLPKEGEKPIDASSRLGAVTYLSDCRSEGRASRLALSTNSTLNSTTHDHFSMTKPCDEATYKHVAGSGAAL